MSDVAKHYMHPKKSLWRSEFLPPEKNIVESEDCVIKSVANETEKMVIVSKLKADNNNETCVPKLPQGHNKVPQELPLDFSVKNSNCSNENGNLHNGNKFINSPTNGNPALLQNTKTSDITNSLYVQVNQNFNSTINGHNDRNGSIEQNTYHSPVHRVISHNPCSFDENDWENWSKENDKTAFQTNVNISNRSESPSSERYPSETTLLEDKNKSPRSSPNGSRRNSPSAQSNPILLEILAHGSGERAQLNTVNSYGQNYNIAAQNESSLPGTSTNASLISSNNPSVTIPDNSSLLPQAAAIIHGHTPFPGGNLSYLNAVGYASTAINSLAYNRSFLPVAMDIKSPLTTEGDKKPMKPVRPFKALTNEILYGVPGVGLNPGNSVLHNVGFYNSYLPAQAPGYTNGSVEISPNPTLRKDTPHVEKGAMNTSPPDTTNGTERLKPDGTGSGDSNCSYNEGTCATEAAESTSNSRKRGRTLPDELKDDTYWERRRKNNEAAKRSRDARRQKEDMVARQAWFFREQNVQLQIGMAALKELNNHLETRVRYLTDYIKKLELELERAKSPRTKCVKFGSDDNIAEHSINNSYKRELHS